MCGIVGAFCSRLGAASADTVITAMRDRMAHRGPDGAGLWRSHDGRCALGHRRLSIIDLSAAAAQPMANAAETVVISFNGEIYNHADIRHDLAALGKYDWQTDHSDTEVLLHAFEEWGLACLDRLYGMFAFAVWDGRDPSRPKVHLARDRLGVKPLYLTRSAKGEWLFASEIKALIAHPDIPREMDHLALWHYLTFIVAPAPLTMFKGIFKLPAGWRMTIDVDGRAQAEQWWDCRPSAAATLRESDLSVDEAGGELLRLLRQAVARRMVADVPFGVLLSGGVDSSLNVALMSELMDRPVKTFTIGYEAYEAFNEFDYARRIASRYNTDHHERRINSDEALKFLPDLVRLMDEPVADNVSIPLYFLAGLVKDSGTTVVQVGEGADENFLGYWWCEHYRSKDQQVYQPARRGALPWWRRLQTSLPRYHGEDAEIAARARVGQRLFWGGAVCWWGNLRQQLTPSATSFQAGGECPVEGLLPPSFLRFDSHQVVDHYQRALDGRLANPEILQKITYQELKLRLPEHLLMRVDKMTMAHSVEARVPFLDHDVVEFAARLPLSYKLRDGVGKFLIKKLAEPFVDLDLLYRRKQGFGAPMDHWFTETEFGRRCQRLYDDSAFRRLGLIDDSYFRGMLDDLVSGRRSGYGFHAWTVINAVLWHEIWIENRVIDF